MFTRVPKLYVIKRRYRDYLQWNTEGIMARDCLFCRHVKERFNDAHVLADLK